MTPGMRQRILDVVEVADSARKHGVADEDMRHAVRVPFRVIGQEGEGEDRALFIGVDRSGRLREVVVVQKDTGSVIIHAGQLRPKSTTTCEVVAMANTKARGSVEDRLDSLDPATAPASDAADLRRIGAALRNVEEAERDLTEAVAAAREQGRSWAMIGMVLGISRQAAQQRFAGKMAA